MIAHSNPGPDRWLFLLGGAAAIVGSLIGMAGNLIHPETPLDDPMGVARTIAESQAWLPIHLAIIVGIVLMFGGLVALAYSIRGDLAVALARLALAATIAGVTVGLVLVILDGVAAPQLAEQWAQAPATGRAAALSAVTASETLNFALASLFNILFAGVAIILLGLAVATGEGYPRWLGVIAVLGGLESIGAGVIQAEAGEPVLASRVLTIVGPTVITLWLLVMGILLVRTGYRMGTANPPAQRTIRQQVVLRDRTFDGGSPMSAATRRLAGLLLILVPAVAFGGASLLSMIMGGEAGYLENSLRQDLWRAGHAHAGVLLILALVMLRYVDEATLSGRWRWLASHGVPIAAILMPVGFFLSVLDGEATEPNAAIYLVFIGGLFLVGGVLTLGIGLLRAGHTASRIA